MGDKLDTNDCNGYTVYYKHDVDKVLSALHMDVMDAIHDARKGNDDAVMDALNQLCRRINNVIVNNKG